MSNKKKITRSLKDAYSKDVVVSKKKDVVVSKKTDRTSKKFDRQKEIESDIKNRIQVKGALKWCIIGLIVSYSAFILSYLGGIVANTFWKCNFDLDMMRREISVVIAFGLGSLVSQVFKNWIGTSGSKD